MPRSGEEQGVFFSLFILWVGWEASFENNRDHYSDGASTC